MALSVFAVLVTIGLVAIFSPGDGPEPAKATASCEELWQQYKHSFLAPTDDENSPGARHIHQQYVQNCNDSRSYIGKEIGQ